MLYKILIIGCFALFFTYGSSPFIFAQEEYEVVFEDEEESGKEEKVPVYTPPAKRNLITPEEFIKIQKENSALLLDVRGIAELKYGVIKNTVNIPLYVLDTEYTKLPKDKEIILFCDNGMRALFAFDLLIGKGFTKLRFLNNSIKFSKTGEYEIIILLKKPN